VHVVTAIASVIVCCVIRFLDIPAPTNLMISEIRCTSALVTWDKPTNGSVSRYVVHWRLLDDGENMSVNVRARDGRRVMLKDLLPSNDGNVRKYSVRVSSVKLEQEGRGLETVFSTHSNGMYIFTCSNTFYSYI